MRDCEERCSFWCLPLPCSNSFTEAPDRNLKLLLANLSNRRYTYSLRESTETPLRSGISFQVLVPEEHLTCNCKCMFDCKWDTKCNLGMKWTLGLLTLRASLACPHLSHHHREKKVKSINAPSGWIILGHLHLQCGKIHWPTRRKSLSMRWPCRCVKHFAVRMNHVDTLNTWCNRGVQKSTNSSKISLSLRKIVVLL